MPTELCEDELPEDYEIRLGIAERHNIPQTLEALAHDAEYSVRCAVARNPSCPPGTLEALARDDEKDVRNSVAGNPSCLPRTLEALASDDESSVRERVARNPRCPLKELKVLAYDEINTVRRAAASNTALPIRELCRPRPPATSVDCKDFITMLSELIEFHVSGFLTDDEFSAAKRKLGL